MVRGKTTCLPIVSACISFQPADNMHPLALKQLQHLPGCSLGGSARMTCSRGHGWQICQMRGCVVFRIDALDCRTLAQEWDCHIHEEGRCEETSSMRVRREEQE